MRKTYAYLVCLTLFLISLPVFMLADETQKPGYQIADNTFFDPTKKEKEVEPYTFGVEWRVEAGYVQHNQRTENLSYPDLFLHGARIGGTCTFQLPLHFGLETGLLYTLLYGRNEQHWRSMTAPTVQEEYIRHRVMAHYLTIPVRAFYTIPLWKELNLFFYGGPQLHIGLAEKDYMRTHLSPAAEAWLTSQGIPVQPYDRMAEELVRANIQMGVGGGLEWGPYRLQSGYDFGLNNLVNRKHAYIPTQKMTEWGWYVSFCYQL